MSTQNTIIEKMFEVGAHYGYSKSRRHPSVVPYIFATKNGVDIINIEKGYDLFENALEAVKKYASSGKIILFVGTKAEAKQQIIETALSLNMPYVAERWVGGSLTNFSEIKKRIAKLLEFREQKEKGNLDKYTKKERLLIDREVEDMTKNFQGLSGLTRVPDVMFVIDPKKEHIACTEAHKMKIPVIALLNTDCNLKQVEYPIIANDASISSIEFFLQSIKDAYNKGSIGDKK
ncbi:MAG: 30S ribosomal protein S2 [Patescibacteria group bacterium]|nr:30S ribosomal protein S2 [Patescibacteria group bacterium]